MSKSLTPIFTILIIFFVGCAAPLHMTKPPKDSLARYRYLQFAKIQNDVVGTVDTTILDKTLTESVKRIVDLKRFDKVIVDDNAVLTKSKVIESIVRESEFRPDSASVAVLKVTLTNYDEGSGALRFFIGFGAGSGNVGLELRAFDRSTNEVLMEAKTEADITRGLSGMSDAVTPLAKAITKFVKDNFKKEK